MPYRTLTPTCCAWVLLWPGAWFGSFRLNLIVLGSSDDNLIVYSCQGSFQCTAVVYVSCSSLQIRAIIFIVINQAVDATFGSVLFGASAAMDCQPLTAPAREAHRWPLHLASALVNEFGREVIMDIRLN
jgi:hypothetical protein